MGEWISFSDAGDVCECIWCSDEGGDGEEGMDAVDKERGRDGLVVV